MPLLLPPPYPHPSAISLLNTRTFCAPKSVYFNVMSSCLYSTKQIYYLSLTPSSLEMKPRLKTVCLRSGIVFGSRAFFFCLNYTLYTPWCSSITLGVMGFRQWENWLKLLLTPVVSPVDWLAIQQSPQEYRTPGPESPGRKERGRTGWRMWSRKTTNLC